jgi:hypothetical protein
VNFSLYRVRLNPDTKLVDISGFDTDIVDSRLFGSHTQDDLPEWMKRKLAVLAVTTAPSGYIDGVGERLNERMFWIEPEECYGMP